MPDSEETDNVRQRSSMTHWYPRLEKTGVPTPETEWVHIRDWDAATEFTEGVPMPDIDAVREAVETVGGPPAFVRSDQASDKHSMAKASRVTSTDEDHLFDHVFEVLQFNNLAGFTGLPFTDLAVREWFDLKHEFTAFGETPIASEIRVFLHEGDVHDYGFYWPADAIEQHGPTHNNGDGLRGDWRTLLSQVREHALGSAEDDVLPLAEQVGEEFADGYWSVDFAETNDGDWYAIDMAVGKASWHPDGCEKPGEL